MEHIIIIRLVDPGGQVFQQIMNVIRNSQCQVEVIDTTELSFPGLKINLDTGVVICDGKRLKLNHSEFSVLCHMAEHPGRIFSNDQLYMAVYGEQPYGTNTVPTIICRLRSKLERNPREPQYIRTVVGQGYKFEPPEEIL